MELADVNLQEEEEDRRRAAVEDGRGWWCFCWV